MCMQVVWAAPHSFYEEGHDFVALLADDILAATPDCCWDMNLCWLLNPPLDIQLWSSVSLEMDVNYVATPVLVPNLPDVSALPGTTLAP